MRALTLGLLLAGSWLHSGSADEPREFYGKNVTQWIAVLRAEASTEAERKAAAIALGYFGPEARTAVRDLAELARQGRFEYVASQALARIDPTFEAPVPQLIEQFIKDGWEHYSASGATGFDSAARDSLVRVGAPAVPALIDLLNGQNRRMRPCAAEALGLMGKEAASAVPSLQSAIVHSENDQPGKVLRRYAVVALGRIGPAAKAAAPTLDALLDKNDNDSYHAAIALDGIGAPPVRKLAMRLVRDGDVTSTEVLGWLGPRAREAIPTLRSARASERLQVRVAAAVALARIDPGAEEAIPVLVEGLEHLEDRKVYAPGVPGALAVFGPKAGAALPALMRFANGPDPLTEILKALVQIDPHGEKCVPVLAAALSSEDDRVADTAAKCLALLGPRAKEAIPALKIAMAREFNPYADRDHCPQRRAVRALARIGPGDSQTISALIAALEFRGIPGDGNFGGRRDDSGYSVAAAAALALGSLGRDAKAAVPALIEAMQPKELADNEECVVNTAALALAQIGPDARPAVPALERLVRNAPTHAAHEPRGRDRAIQARARRSSSRGELAESTVRCRCVLVVPADRTTCDCPRRNGPHERGRGCGDPYPAQTIRIVAGVCRSAR